jgi:hypothetical protein
MDRDLKFVDRGQGVEHGSPNADRADRELDLQLTNPLLRGKPDEPAHHAAIGLVDELVDDNCGLGAKRQPGIV